MIDHPSAPTDARGGPPIVLVHGLEDSPQRFDPLRRRLAGSGLHTVAPTLPWHRSNDYSWVGRGEPGSWIDAALRGAVEGSAPDEHGTRRVRRTAPPAIDTVIDTAIDTVIAHSFGANAVLAHLMAAATDPGLIRIRRLVVLSPFYKPAAVDFDAPMRERARAGLGTIVRESMALQLVGRGLPDDLIDSMGSSAVEVVPAAAYEAFFRAYACSGDLELHRITDPCLVLAGTDDIGMGLRHAEVLRQCFPAAEVRIRAGVGHFPHVTDPGFIAGEIVRFLSACPPVTSGVRSRGRRPSVTPGVPS